MKTVRLKIAKIVADPDVQPRAGGLHKPTVEEYAERLSHGDEFPAPVVYWDGKVYWLSEGFHRLAAHIQADLADELQVEKRDGDKDEAALNALGSNRTHGLKRTNADKRRAVEIALRLRPKWTDRRIAEAAGVSHTFVAEVRGALATVANAQSDYRETKDGREYPSTRQTATTSEENEASEPDEPTVVEAVQAPVKVVPPPVVDGWGVPIQSHAVEAFAVVPKFKELIAVLKQAQRLFNEVANEPGGKFLTLPEVSSYRRGKKGDDGEHADRFVHDGIETAIRQVTAQQPTHTVCPWSYAEAKHPDDCPTCRGLNWTPQLGKNIPDAIIQRIKEAFGV